MGFIIPAQSLSCSWLALMLPNFWKENKSNQRNNMIFRLTFWFAMVLTFVGLLKIKSINGAVGCYYKHKNYTACTVMINLAPTPCNGNDCPLGLQRSDKGICCPKTSENETIDITKAVCKKNCNLSDSDFYDLSPYVPPSTTLTERVTLGAGIATSPPLTTTETVYTTPEKATISNAANMIGSHKIYM